MKRTKRLSAKPFSEHQRHTILKSLVLFFWISFFVSGCSTNEIMDGRNDTPVRDSAANDVIAASVAITRATNQAELIPAAFMAGVKASKQNITLLSYSEYGNQCELYGKNGYTTDSTSPGACEDCGESCPAREVGGKTLDAFTHPLLGKQNAPKIPTLSFAPVVGVNEVPMNKLSPKGRFISSRSSQLNAGNLSLACFGPSWQCTGPTNTKHALAFNASQSIATDSEVGVFDKFKTIPRLSLIPGPMQSGIANRGIAGGWGDPLISTIASATGSPIKEWPAKVTLKSSIGSVNFQSITLDGIGETVFEAFLRNPGTKKKTPLWSIRFLFGEQIDEQKGYRVEVRSADNLHWQLGNNTNQGNHSAGDRRIASLIEKQLEASINRRTGEVTAVLNPKKGKFIPLEYVLVLEEDAELVEGVQTTAIDRNLEKPDTCKDEFKPERD